MCHSGQCVTTLICLWRRAVTMLPGVDDPAYRGPRGFRVDRCQRRTRRTADEPSYPLPSLPPHIAVATRVERRHSVVANPSPDQPAAEMEPTGRLATLAPQGYTARQRAQVLRDASDAARLTAINSEPRVGGTPTPPRTRVRLDGTGGREPAHRGRWQPAAPAAPASAAPRPGTQQLRYPAAGPSRASRALRTSIHTGMDMAVAIVWAQSHGRAQVRHRRTLGSDAPS